MVEVETVRANWSSMQWNPELDIDFFTFIVDAPVGDCSASCYCGLSGQPVSLLAGRLENGHFEAKFGYRVLWRCKVRQVGIFYGGFMGRTNPKSSGW